MTGGMRGGTEVKGVRGVTGEEEKEEKKKKKKEKEETLAQMDKRTDGPIDGST